MNEGRRRAVLFLATLGTFGTALVGLYALTVLWLAHDAADRWAVAIAFAVAASGAVDKALSPWADHAPPAATPPDTDPPDPEPEPSGGHPRGAHERVTTAVVTAAVTAAAAAVVYGVLAPKAKGGDTVSASSGYTLVYGHRTLSLKNYNYAFDLRAGAVSGSESSWSVSTNAGGDGNGAFEIQPLTDAYVVPGKTAPSAAQCAAKATRRPAKGWIHFRQAPPGRTVCLRDTTNGDIAVFTVIDVDHGNYATTDDITYYRHQS
ncbi:hypothetical protein [Streptomyces sp. GbtcB6]|uniref:hypothetical protein n=1 Tax=Streptomyces sp. GbtcB6 TaxID=2824751 RepID=UPI001C2FFE7E|nr:hypothetical protein [Streptomyces sp. GbtcB6]